MPNGQNNWLKVRIWIFKKRILSRMELKNTFIYSSASVFSTENGSGTAIDPLSLITTSRVGLSLESVANASIFLTTFIPFTIFPKTTCRPSNHVVCFVVMKNWDPLVSLPALAYGSITFKIEIYFWKKVFFFLPSITILHRSA